MRALAVLAMITLSVHGATLSDLLATAEKLRKLEPESEMPPELVTFKHQLRDWIESRLPLGVTDEQLMAELKKAGLTSTEPSLEMGFGYVTEIEISRPENYPGALAVRTGLSIPCGTDESWYIYDHDSETPKRVFEYERSDHANYLPQTSSELLVSIPNSDGSHLALITAMNP